MLDSFSGIVKKNINIRIEHESTDEIKIGALYVKTINGRDVIFVTFLVDKRLQLVRVSSDEASISLDWSKEILNTFEHNDIVPMFNFMFPNPYDQD